MMQYMGGFKNMTEDELQEMDKLIEQTAESQITKKEVEEQIAAYEQMFGMSSEELLQSMHDGTAPDTFEINVWMALLEISL